MNAEYGENITALLLAWRNGDEAAAKEVMSIAYPELRRIARRHLGHCAPDQSLESAALVNEAYIKLIHARKIRWEGRVHFFALCAQVIRQILVDHARKRRYGKRGGDAVQVPLEESLLGTRARSVEVLALDEALTALWKIDARKSRVVELRFFGGLTVDETADVLRISVETVLRDWRIARTWLFRELTRKAAE
jgi:RNA polymerase sigma-70 factor (ECF subfamily)